MIDTAWTGPVSLTWRDDPVYKDHHDLYVGRMRIGAVYQPVGGPWRAYCDNYCEGLEDRQFVIEQEAREALAAHVVKELTGE